MIRPPRLTSVALLWLGTLSVGCGSPVASPSRQAVEITFESQSDAALRQHRPLAVLAFDPSRGEVDRLAKSAFESASSGAVTFELDLTSSRNRANAAPLHGLDTPTLVCLSSAGIICSRDEAGISVDLVRQRIASADELGPALDTDFARLTADTEANPADVDQQMVLADFLLAHHNDAQAEPQLKRVAYNESANRSVRVRAWVALGRSYLWMVEPEKARHAAQALIAKLGPRSPEALAGGNLIRGLQDTKAKRFDRARDELAAAAEAAPVSPYGREAAALLAKLPSALQR